MTNFNYYVVTSYVNNFPFFTTCAEIKGRFFRISNLELYLNDGLSGVTDEEITPKGFKLINSTNFSL